MSEVVYGKTPLGQLLYDLAFTNLSAKYIARKHKKPVAEIRELRTAPAVRKLRRQNKLPARAA